LRFGLVCLAALLLFCACAPEPTPLPVILPTLPPSTATPALDATLAPLRYAVAPDALPFLSDADRAAIAAAGAELVPLAAPPADADLSTYDLVVSAADFPGASAVPSELQVSLTLNTTLPLDNPALADVVRAAIDPQRVAQSLGFASDSSASPSLTTAALRETLANAGYPDGFDLTFASRSLPGADALTRMLGAVGIDAREVAADTPAHLALTTAPPDANAIALYRLSLHFHAADGLTITFTPSGFPLASR
jgi:hypothetical protein